MVMGLMGTELSKLLVFFFLETMYQYFSGSLPYLGTALSSAYLARQAGLAASGMLTSINPETAIALLMDCLHVQVTYGAVLMSFTGM